MTLAKRVQQLVEYSELSIPKFAEKVGFKTPQGVRELIKGTTKTLSDAAQYKIASAFPELNLTWLLTGEGEMLKPGPTQIVSGPGAHHFTQTGDVAAPADGAAQSAATIDRLIDEMGAQRTMFQQLLDRQQQLLDRQLAMLDRKISAIEKLADDRTRTDD